MKIQRLLPLIAIVALAAGCAVGNKYNYELETLPLPVSGDASVGVSVIDSRPYVLDGDKEPDFVGLQRGGFGNPFNVTTQSGRPLAEDMQSTIADGLAKKGFKVKQLRLNGSDANTVSMVASRDGLERVIVLDVKEWKTDVMHRITMHYDLNLSVYDTAGILLGETSRARSGEAVGGAKFASGNSEMAASQFERVMGDMFGAPEIREALQ